MATTDIDEVILLRKSEWAAAQAELEELREAVALLVDLAHEHEASIVTMKDALGRHSLLD